jgi:hypothetical protein
MELSQAALAARWIADARPDLTFNAQPSIRLDWDEGLGELEGYGYAGAAVQLAAFDFGDLWWRDPEGREVSAHRFLLVANGASAASIQYFNYDTWQSRFTSALLDAAHTLERASRGLRPDGREVVAGLAALNALNQSIAPPAPALVDAADFLQTLSTVSSALKRSQAARIRIEQSGSLCRQKRRVHDSWLLSRVQDRCGGLKRRPPSRSTAAASWPAVGR